MRRLLTGLLFVVAGCSLLTNFDPEGQPCDLGECLSGYACVAGRCVKGDAGSGGGIGGGGGGGGVGGGGGSSCPSGCSSTQDCVNGTCYPRTCVPDAGVTDAGLGDGGTDAGTDGGADAGPRPQCAIGAVCPTTSCVPSACIGVSCDAGTVCSAGTCEPTSCDGGPFCGGGKACRSGRCVDLSCQGLTCPSGQRCAQAICLPCDTSETSCNDGLDNDCDQATDCSDSDCNSRLCDDNNLCTINERCAGGSCVNGVPSVACNTPGACQGDAGTCTPSTGRCSYPPLADGASCGAAESSRCCGGSCVNTSNDPFNCGGCGLVCGSGSCEPADVNTCFAVPTQTSGRCSCSSVSTCPASQGCWNNTRCSPDAGSNCATGQVVVSWPSCPSYCRYP